MYTQVYKSRYEENERKLEKTEKLIADIKKNLSGLNGISELLGISSANSDDKQKNLLSVIKKIHPFTDFFVMMVLLGIIGVTLPKSCDSKDSPKTNLLASADVTKTGTHGATMQAEDSVEEGAPETITTFWESYSYDSEKYHHYEKIGKGMNFLNHRK